MIQFMREQRNELRDLKMPTGWYVGAVVCALLTLFLVWIVVAAASTHPTALVALVLTPLGIYATAVLAKWLVER